MMKKPMAHCSPEHDYSCEEPRLQYADGGRYFNIKFARSPGMAWNQEQFYKFDRAKRGACQGFSFGSRRRMLDRLNQISSGAELPVFVTCTLPDDSFNDSVTEFAKIAKAYLDNLLKRLHRACPSACGIWKIEWKARKSGEHVGKLFPHFHLLVWGLPQRSLGLVPIYDKETGEMVDAEERFEAFVPVRDCQLKLQGLLARLIDEKQFKKASSRSKMIGRRAEMYYRNSLPAGDGESWMSLKDWVSLAWYHVVGTGNTDHFEAGCRVEQLRSWGGVLAYCAKYMSKADAESFLSEVPAGRHWGIFNREFMPWAKMVSLPLSDEQGVRLRRVARRYLEHAIGRRVQRHFGITIYCDTAPFKRLLHREPDTPF